MPIIEVEGLEKTFKTRDREAGLASSLRSFIAPRYRERQAVKHISFSLEAGEVLAFIGPNGAGKSTAIKMLTGILYPSGGKATVLGLTPWRERRTHTHRLTCARYHRIRHASTAMFALWYLVTPRPCFFRALP